MAWEKCYFAVGFILWGICVNWKGDWGARFRGEWRRRAARGGRGEGSSWCETACLLLAGAAVGAFLRAVLCDLTLHLGGGDEAHPLVTPVLHALGARENVDLVAADLL